MSNKKNKTRQLYGKQAYVNAADSSKERLIVQALLEDEKKYSPDEVKKLIQSWKQKEAK
ncbi:hypothetical protein [Psychrobacillus sp.]|uniref:hypothetical protein n=1 Tax=Psychrobacillus sp. TaxID=1871623 RepID=UPI0028BDA92E|nr:hypothetical protein [Psychrobacillus sp.]